MEFFGRLHPLLLHIPIGFLLLAYLMEVKDKWSKAKEFTAAIRFSLSLGTWSAILAATSGYLLSKDGRYNPDLLFWHQWLGIFTAVFSILVKFLHTKNPSSKFYFYSFTLLILLVSSAGHYGGSLTHGTDFLTAPFEEKKEKKVIVNIEEALLFEDIIQPIFNEKCIACHKQSKSKGGLLMTSLTTMLKGGDTGAIFVKNDAVNSLFVKRIHLPLEEKEHMPPKGKTQLTTDEITLLEWWVNEGGLAEKNVGKYQIPDDIRGILEQYASPKDRGVFDLEVDFAKEKHLIALKEAGFDIQVLQKEKPFIEVVWRGEKSPTKTDFKLLENIEDQLISLNIAGVDLEEGSMNIIGNLPHLQKLSLQKTSVTNKTLSALKNVKYLNYLNLYGTEITDDGLTHLKEFTALKKLFLWQTLTTPKEVAQLQKMLPNLDINTGVSATIFGKAQLIANKDMFSDSLVVLLQHGLVDAQLHYSLNGIAPDKTSAVYKKPIVLKESAEIQVFAQKEGWEDSDTVRIFFPKMGYTVATAKLSAAPDKNYAANGSKSLIDMRRGTTDFRDGKWLGYQGTNVEIILDLGTQKAVNRLTVSTLEDTNSYIFFPTGLEIFVSKNGQNFKQVATKNFATTKESLPSELKLLSVNFSEINAQLIKVKIKSQLKNPAWHSTPGAPSWFFVDEILVE